MPPGSRVVAWRRCCSDPRYHRTRGRCVQSGRRPKGCLEGAGRGVLVAGPGTRCIWSDLPTTRIAQWKHCLPIHRHRSFQEPLAGWSRPGSTPVRHLIACNRSHLRALCHRTHQGTSGICQSVRACCMFPVRQNPPLIPQLQMVALVLETAGNPPPSIYRRRASLTALEWIYQDMRLHAWMV